MKCNKCGALNDASSKFCRECGNTFSNQELKECKCGARILSTFKCCPYCGNKFDDNDVESDKSKNKNKNKTVTGLKKRDQDFLFMFLAFMLPVFGICYYFVGKKEDKKIATYTLIIGISSMVLRVLYEVVFGILFKN